MLASRDVELELVVLDGGTLPSGPTGKQHARATLGRDARADLLVLAWRFRQSVAGVVLQPVSVLALPVVQWAALLRDRRGRPSTWQERADRPI